MIKLKPLITIIAIVGITFLCASCFAPQTEEQIIENTVLRFRERGYGIPNREILDINEPVRAIWHQHGGSMNIIPLVDDENAPLDFIIGIPFQSPPNFDSYGRGGPNSHFVETFMEQINEKHLEGIVLNSFIQQDLIITLEFSDGSKVIFDRFYAEIRENLDDFRRFRCW